MKKELTSEQKAKRAACQNKYRQTHKDKVAAYQKQYRKDHRGEIAVYNKQYQQDHKANKAIYDGRYYQGHKVKIAEQHKGYKQGRKIEIAAYQKRYRQGHKIDRAIYKRRRFFGDTDYRLKVIVGNEIRQSVNGVRQYRHSLDLLGCSIKELREHLERQFLPGMTWDNWNLYGWHIDHIIPLSYFDFRDPEQQKRAWHYTNLRPLWAKDNLKKRNKIEERQLLLL